jgi:hypothetical protein
MNKRCKIHSLTLKKLERLVGTQNLFTLKRDENLHIKKMDENGFRV